MMLSHTSSRTKFAGGEMISPSDGNQRTVHCRPAKGAMKQIHGREDESRFPAVLTVVVSVPMFRGTAYCTPKIDEVISASLKTSAAEDCITKCFIHFLQ